MMAFSLNDKDIARVKELLKRKHLKISVRDVAHKLETIIKSQEVFPLEHQQVLMIQLLINFKKSKRKEAGTGKTKTWQLRSAVTRFLLYADR